MAERFRIPLSNRDIAGHLLMRLARHPIDHHDTFALSEVYDYDAEFLFSLAKDMEIPSAFPWRSYIDRLRKVCRELERSGLLWGRTSSCHAEYMGEPRTLKQYGFSNPSYACRLSPERHEQYKPMMSPENELEFLLDRLYPRKD